MPRPMYCTGRRVQSEDVGKLSSTELKINGELSLKAGFS